MRATEKNEELAEVKAVLRRLQRLDLSSGDDSEEIALQSPAAREFRRPASPRAAYGSGGIELFNKKLAAVDARKDETASAAPAARAFRAGGLAPYLGIALIVTASLAAVAFSGLFNFNSSASTAARNGAPQIGVKGQAAALSAKGKEDEAKLLNDARRLLSEGDVAGARRRLLASGMPETAETALMLAQSFDPNYLRTLSRANAQADRAQAERWYRKWYELAINSGLAMDSARLQHIIAAMK